ncbi:MAG: thioredoxin family protein [Proteobacteria bacterium]|nr:thioredoxin family protein [Pseudomonadota bacterium]
MRRFSWALWAIAAVLLAGGVNLEARHHAAAKRAAAAKAAALMGGYAEISAYSPAALAEAKSQGRPILVAFQGAGCRECEAQQKAIRQMAADRSYSGLRVLLVDVDKQLDALRALGATMRSTLVVFQGRKEITRSVGVTDSDAIRSAVRRTLI